MIDFDMIDHITRTLHNTYNDMSLAAHHAQWIAHAVEHCSDKHQKEAALSALLKRITQDKEPIQYVLGSVPFCSVEITVKPPVLIPRPETEEWVARLCTQLHHAAFNTNIAILDIGTGSGAIGLALAKALPHATVHAVDISPHALALSNYNRMINGIKNCIIIESNLFEAISTMQFDLIVSNPPYISDAEFEHVDDSVKKWEDKNALVAADNGFALIKKIIDAAPSFLKEKSTVKESKIPQLWIEIGYKQGPVVKQYMLNHGFLSAEISTDYANNDRIVTGSLL